jgi:flagellar hook assembly protein FlgD
MPIQSNYSSPYTTGAGTASGPGAGSRSALSGTASSKARALSDDNGEDTEKSNSSEKTNSKEGTNSTDSTGSSGNVIDAVFGDGDDKKVSMDDFLTLMVAQLKNQDFMNPVDDTQYVTQLAQISTMQQMEEMAYNAKSSYVASLVGKNVSAAKFTVSGELKKADGVVEKISLLDGKFVIYVDGEAFSMDEIMEIKDKTAAEGSGENNETPPNETPPDGTPPDKTPPDK